MYCPRPVLLLEETYKPPVMGKRSLKSNPSVKELKKRAENLLPSEDAQNTGLRVRMLLGRRIVRWKDRYRHWWWRVRMVLRKKASMKDHHGIEFPNI
jgi:hypothetical protein